MPRSRAKWAALPVAGEATATLSTSGTIRAAAAWRSAKNPVPMSPIFTVLADLSSTPKEDRRGQKRKEEPARNPPDDWTTA
jgi:hypothetical protein